MVLDASIAPDRSTAELFTALDDGVVTSNKIK